MNVNILRIPPPTHTYTHVFSFSFFFFLCVCVFLRAAPLAYRGSQARGLIRATVAGLHHSHSNAGSEPRL